jgi:hypothetical protein
MGTAHPPFFLRPLEIKHLFDFSIRLYRSAFAPLLLSMAMVQLPAALLTLPFFVAMVNLMNELQGMANTGAMPNEAWALQHIGYAIGAIVLVVGSLAYHLMVLPLANLTCAKLAVSSAFGTPVRFDQAFRHALTRYWPTQVALATYFLPVLALSLLLLIVVAAFSVAGATTGVIAASVFALLAIPAGLFATLLIWFRFFPALAGILQTLEEPQGENIFTQGVAYLRRAYELTRGYYWRLFGLYILLVIAISFLTRGISGSAELAYYLGRALTAREGAEQVLNSALSGKVDAWMYGIVMTAAMLASVFFAPLMMCFEVLLYLDLRCRKEAFDLVMLLRRSGAHQ